MARVDPNQSLQISDQVFQLGHLDVVLNDIARIQKANRVYILVNGLLVFLLLKEFISMLLDDLTLDFSWETCLFSYRLRLRIMTLFHEVVYLDIVLHWVQLY